MEIKFRAYSKEDNKFYYATLDEICKEIGFEYGMSDDVLGFSKDVVKTQYTGLKDKNGTEIYEGDIVFGEFGGDYDLRQGIIEYATEDVFPDTGAHESATATGFHIKCSECSYYQGLAFPEDLEVTGNIFQNPELLK